MKVSTKGRYGLRAMVDLAVNGEDGPLSLVNVAERQNISLNYLEQVVASLRKAGLIKSLKGSQGGYTLAREAGQIKVKEILDVLEGRFTIVDEDIFEEDHIDGVRLAVKKLLWDRINEEVNTYLANTTLEDLVIEYQKLNKSDGDMYYI